ncbi:hypothetical protein ACSBR2_030747 [Camellia fascicularis]
MEGSTEILNQNKNHLKNQLTPNNNTVLHVVAHFGHIQCVMEILNMCPSMYQKANELNDEPKNGVGIAKDMIMMSNKETPLYLAAEKRYVGLVFVILETCTVSAYGGPGGRTAPHSVVIHNLEGCTWKLLQWKPSLSKETDTYGWTLLHYAARFGYVLRARDLLNADKSVAYIADKDNKKIALHLVASQGHVRVIEELISHRMDCWKIVNDRGQNILHIVKDVNGNTPLHLLAAFDCYEASLVKHSKADMMAFNDDSLTPLDVVCSNKSVEQWVRMPTLPI